MKYIINILLIASTSAIYAMRDTEPITLRVISEDYPPMNFQEKGEPKGICTAIVKAVLAKANVQYKAIEFLPWARGYAITLNEPNTMIYSIYRTPAREKLFHFVGPLLEIYSEFLVLAQNQDRVKINSLEDAKKYKIGTMNEDVAEQFLIGAGFTKGVNIESSLDFATGFRKLFDGRLDAMYYPMDSAIEICKAAGLDYSKLVSVYRPTPTERGPEIACIGLSKAKNSEETPALLQKAFDELKADGTVDRIAAEERSKILGK